MKHFNASLSKILFFLVLLNTYSKAQNVNALIIVYDVSYPTQTPILNSIYFKQCIMYAKGSNVLYKYFTQDNGISTSVTNDCNESTYNSFPYKDEMQMKVPKNGLRSAFKLEASNVSITDETKVILGLKCKKVISETKNVVGTILKNTYYISEKIDSAFCSSVSIAGLSGWMFGCEPINCHNSILLGAEIDMGKGATQVWTAKSIGFKSVESSIFNIPEKAVMTYDEYNKKIGTDKAFRKEMMKEIRNDKTAEFNKQVWASLMKDLGKVLQSEEFKSGVEKLSTAIININGSNSGSSSVEGLAISSSSKKDGNSPEGIACAKEAKYQWEASEEYKTWRESVNDINAPSLRYGELAKAKNAEILLEHCKQFLSQQEISALTEARDNCLKNANEMKGNTTNPK